MTSLHTALSRARTRWLTLTGCAIVCTAVFVACSDNGTTRTAPTGPLFAAGGALTVNLDQCANAPRTANCSWQNGDLNGNNSTYAEGLAVPFRLEIDGLRTGSHSIHINYDFTAGGHEGYDFLADFDATEKVDLCATGGGGRAAGCDVLSGGLTKNNASAIVTFPSDGFAVPGANNLLVSGAEASAIFGVSAKRHLYAWGATIDSIRPAAGPLHAGPTDGNSTSDFIVYFTNAGSSVAFAWSGHLAQSSYWKNSGATPDGADQISGAPWHMRTQQLDNSGNKNQDRSIQPSALVSNPVLQITKTPATQTVDAGQSFSWTLTLTNGGPGSATGATIVDTLPTITGVSYAKDASSDASCTLSGRVLTCGPKDLAEGASIVAKINATTTAGSGCSTTAYTNTATGKAGNAVSVSASATVTIQCPSLSITKTPDKSGDTGYSVSPGDSARFTITVSNAGPGSASSVVITDTLPSNLTWVDNKTECSVSSSQILTCSLTSLAANASFSVVVATLIPANFLVQTPVPGGSSIAIDGNLIVDPSPDWASPPTNLDGKTLSCVSPLVGCARDTTGATDNSFGQGTSENDAVPTVVDGSIPNNKSDLTRFYITNNRITVGSAVHDIVYLGWERVQAPTGTTNMDFELNQSSTLSSNGVTPVRTAGDILVEYDLAKGGSVPVLDFHVWVTAASAGGLTAAQACEASNKFPCWGKADTLTTNVAASINTDTVVDPIAPNAPRKLDPLTFGEASIDLQAAGIFSQGVCKHFGAAYLKSRSSDSFTSEIKDFVTPLPVNIANCAPVTLNNRAWAVASGVTAISDTGKIVVSESSSASLFFEPTNLRLARLDASGTVTTSSVVAAMGTFAENSRREVLRTGHPWASSVAKVPRGSPWLAPPGRVMVTNARSVTT